MKRNMLKKSRKSCRAADMGSFVSPCRSNRDVSRPSAASIAERCSASEATFGPGCQFAATYQPAPLAARIAPRPGI